MTIDLVGALKQFNCKERYWLINNALGEPRLDENFRVRLAATITKQTGSKFSIPDDAYWAIDYHINWLAAIFIAPSLNTKPNTEIKENQKDFFEKNQKDVDLIVAFKNTLICVEAKFIGSWDYNILANKIDRMRRIADSESSSKIEVYYVCMSPKKPDSDKLDKELCDYREKKTDKHEQACKENDNASRFNKGSMPPSLAITHNTYNKKNRFLYVSYASPPIIGQRPELTSTKWDSD